MREICCFYEDFISLQITARSLLHLLSLLNSFQQCQFRKPKNSNPKRNFSGRSLSAPEWAAAACSDMVFLTGSRIALQIPDCPLANTAKSLALRKKLRADPMVFVILDSLLE